MSNSRRQLIKQINTLNRTLEQQQEQVIQHKLYFKRYRQKHSGLLLLGIFIPSIWIGWKISGKKWASQLAIQVRNIVSLTFFSYFRRQLVSLLP